VSAHAEDAAFYRAALLLGLLRGHAVIGWADQILGSEATPPAGFVDIATTPPDDLTLLRERLFAVAMPKESAAVVGRLIGLIQEDLVSGRRSFQDTMTVLKQLRAFVTVDRDLNEQVKALGVDVAIAPIGSPERAAAEQRVRDWLHDFGVERGPSVERRPGS
jgi:post-segregation antitoxin (ccd killing protein)